jgi:CRP-like cAMP-binding protein
MQYNKVDGNLQDSIEVEMTYDAFTDILENTEVRSLKRNQFIYHEGDKPNGLYFVEAGVIGLFHISESGKETFLRVFAKNAVFGHRSYLAAENYHASTVALTEVQYKHLSSKECESFFNEKPDALKSIATELARDLGQAEIRLAGLQDKTTNQRIAESLIFLKLKYPEKVWTRKEIAEYSCSSPESVTRFLTFCEDQNIISKMGRDFEILDSDKLLNLPQ